MAMVLIWFDILLFLRLYLFQRFPDVLSFLGDYCHESGLAEGV
jgi:hypothetical protein